MEETNSDILKFGLKQEYISQISSCVFKNPHVEKIIIYGSRAKGNNKKYSDIDLTLVGSNLNHSDLFPILNDLYNLLIPYEIDLSILSEIDNPELLNEIQTYGKILASI